MVEIAAAMKVVLVDHWPPIEPLGPQHQVESLANCRFPDIVAADQECVARQVYDTMSDASEVRDRQTLHFHRVQPPLMPVYSPCSSNLHGKSPSKPYPPPSNPPILAIEVGDLGMRTSPCVFLANADGRIGLNSQGFVDDGGIIAFDRVTVRHAPAAFIPTVRLVFADSGPGPRDLDDV
jgi:hypothetical protein